jgi:hypothetical protein
MNFDLSALSSAILVTVELVPGGIKPHCENVASLRIGAIPEASGGGSPVAGFETANAAGGYGCRSTRIREVAPNHIGYRPRMPLTR